MGATHDSRHRDALYQRFAAELYREARDATALSTAANRILTHPEVAADAELSAQLRSVIASRESEITARRAIQAAETKSSLDPDVPVFTSSAKPQSTAPSKSQINAALDRLRRELDERLSHFDLAGGRDVLARIVETQARYGELVNASMVERCKHDIAACEARKKLLLDEIDSLEARAIESAHKGQHESAAQALKRLSSIHATRPSLLPADRFEKLRQAVASSGEHFEHREISRELVARERLVADELRHIAAAVHEFHGVSHQVPHDHPDYLAAERKYHEAVRELKAHDKEWYADLVVELDELMDDLHDPTGRAAAQVTKFIESVRSALRHIVREIREIREEQIGHNTTTKPK
ncbi:MAG: hypothetical protein ACKVS9_07800 [Phycisphaerae bacterium]